MAQDYFKPKGQAQASKQDAGGGVVRNAPVIGVVKNIIDPTHGGRIQVYIADFGSTNPDDSKSWTTVGYMSPFFGATLPTAGTTGDGTYLENPSSYGMWYSPPDIGSSVICIFVNGDINYGYWIGCIPKPEVLQMVPAIGSSANVIMNGGEAQSYGGATVLPVTNINTNNTSVNNSSKFLNAAKPVHSYQSSIYSQQGLIRDSLRGPITSSALRESPSRVGWGVSTPGRPIYQGGYTDSTIKKAALEGADPKQLKIISRRGGHTIVMDDGDVNGKDQLIRLRTALGHQILMSDDGQTLFIVHSNGQSYIELGKEGTIDMYSTNSVNIRTQGDLNLHADNNININAKKDINMAATNINVNAEKDISYRTGGDFKGYTLGKFTYKVDGAMSMYSGGEGSYASGGVMYVNGSKINLNTGSTSVAPETTSLITAIAHTDTLFDKTKGWASAPGKLLSIVSRAPAHSPWASANQGVNVQVNNNASSELPPAPSGAVTATNASATNTPENVVTTATASTVPALGAVSGSLDGSVTATMVGDVATQAASAASGVVSQGTGIITNAQGQLTAAVGSLAQTPKQLETAGILKPGSSALINGLVQGGSSVQNAMTNNLFTGAPGAENLSALVQNKSAQVGAQIKNFQSAQSALVGSGVLTGAEAPGAIAGIVSAGSQVGIGATTDFVKNAVGSATGAITGATNALGSLAGSASGVAGAVSSAIAGGNFAAGIGTNLTSGLGSIATSLGGIGAPSIGGISGAVDAAKGIAGSAFSAITKSFKPFAAGVPQNLTAIAVKNQEDQAAAEAGAAGGVASGLLADAKSALPSLNVNALAGAASAAAGAAAGSLTASIGSAVGGVTGAITGAASTLGSLNVGSVVNSAASSIGVATGSLTAITAKVSGASSLLSSGTGLGALPGGLSSISSVVGASGALTNVPGLGGVSNLVKNASSAIQNGISLGSSALGAVASLSAGGLGGALNKIASLDASALTKGLSLGNQSLASLAQLGMPASASAALQASINSLSQPGSLPIKLPTVATGTNDRGEINSLLSAVLGSSKIPVPNFAPSVDTAKALENSKKTNELFDKMMKLQDQKDALTTETAKANKNWHNLQNTLPKGDPQIDAAYQVYSDKFDELDAVRNQIIALGKEAGALADRMA
jgi:hypothetical protein